ncbi:hypothetical protein Esti_006731 [Eimeria stiedai]
MHARRWKQKLHRLTYPCPRKKAFRASGSFIDFVATSREEKSWILQQQQQQQQLCCCCREETSKETLEPPNKGALISPSAVWEQVRSSREQEQQRQRQQQEQQQEQQQRSFHPLI